MICSYVAGGGGMAVAVSRALSSYPVQLKVIERDKNRCEELSRIREAIGASTDHE